MVLLHGSNNVNALFRELEQTGFAYKRDVLDAIEYLRKGGLITKKKSPESIKTMISVTEVGRTAGNLIANVEKYTESLSNLKKVIAQKFNVPYLSEEIVGNKKYRKYDEKTLSVILKSRGWSESEIIRFMYDEFKPPLGVFHVLEESPMKVINILLYKYQIFLELKINEIAKRIIEKIVIDLIADLLQNVDVTRLPTTTKMNGILDYASEIVIDHNIAMTHLGGLMYQFINNKMNEVFDRMFSIVEPRGEFIKKRLDAQIKWQKNNLRSRKQEAERHPERWDKAEIYQDESISRVLPFYDEILKKWTA